MHPRTFNLQPRAERHFSRPPDSGTRSSETFLGHPSRVDQDQTRDDKAHIEYPTRSAKRQFDREIQAKKHDGETAKDNSKKTKGLHDNR